MGSIFGAGAGAEAVAGVVLGAGVAATGAAAIGGATAAVAGAALGAAAGAAGFVFLAAVAGGTYAATELPTPETAIAGSFVTIQLIATRSLSDRPDV